MMADNIGTDSHLSSGTKDSSNTITKSLLIGSDKEVSQIIEDVKNNKSSSSWLLTGESGISKSALLDEIYRRFTKEEKDIQCNVFVGYYSKKKSLISKSESFIYPFRIALESLVFEIKN